MEVKKKKGQRKVRILDHTLQVRISKKAYKNLEKIAEDTPGKNVSSIVRELIESEKDAERLPSLKEWNSWNPEQKADYHRQKLGKNPEQESKNSAPLFKLANRIPLIEAEEKRKKRTWLPD